MNKTGLLLLLFLFMLQTLPFLKKLRMNGRICLKFWLG
jgi:hypothetical protein